MDGDTAPVAAMLDAAAAARAVLVVDEAHGTGVFGPGGRGVLSATRGALPQLERAAGSAAAAHPALLAAVHTFGKALGAHGAAVLGSHALRSYLLNYARPLVYSTALPAHAAAAARICYARQASADGDARRAHVAALAALFAEALTTDRDTAMETAPPLPRERLIASGSPIQAVLVPGAERAVAAAAALQHAGFDVRAIRAPTVAAGHERLRIIVHAHNTRREVWELARRIREVLAEQREDESADLASASGG